MSEAKVPRDAGVFGFGRSDTTRACTRSYPLVKVSKASRAVKVNSYARAILEDSARNGTSQSLVPDNAEYSVGETIPHRGRYWVIGRTCFKCYASGWTLLQPVREVHDEGLLPTPIARPCPHIKVSEESTGPPVQRTRTLTRGRVGPLERAIEHLNRRRAMST